MRLINAITEYFEAKAELLREEAATLQLGTYSRGYKDGQDDIKETYGFEIAYIGDDEAEDD